MALAPIFWLSFCSTFLCIFSENHEKSLAPKFTVNLDLPPGDRWTHVVEKYKSQLPKIHQLLTKYIPPELMPLVDFIAESFQLFIPEVFVEEIKGIAKASGMAEGDVFLLNCLYEVSAFCTSIVAQNSEGQILHGRNLDYGSNPAEVGLFKNGTIKVDYQRNGKTLYTATTIVGFTGVVDGQRPHEFTISLNKRAKGNVFENFFMAFFDGGLPDLMAMRMVLENSTSFKEAVHQLSTVKLIADCYYIIGGVSPGEGVVITRDRLKAADIWYLDLNASRWFLVEINYDHWRPSPKSDDRRDQANKAMKHIGQAKLTNDTLMDAMSISPVLNSHTLYTSIMSAAEPSMYRSWVRWDAGRSETSGYQDTTLKFQASVSQHEHKPQKWKKLWSSSGSTP